MTWKAVKDKAMGILAPAALGLGIVAWFGLDLYACVADNEDQVMEGICSPVEQAMAEFSEDPSPATADGVAASALESRGRAENAGMDELATAYGDLAVIATDPAGDHAANLRGAIAVIEGECVR